MSSVPERIWISEHNSDGYDTERTGTFRNEYIRADIHESIFSTCESMLTEARAEIERLEAERHEAYRKGLGFALSALDSVSHDNPMTANDVADVIRAEIEKVGHGD